MKALYGFFLRRPLMSNLLVVFAVIAGIVAASTMKIQMAPDMDLGMVTVTTAFPGASPEDVELSVTVPLEEEILKVDNLSKVTSNSMEALSVIAIRVDPDVDDEKRVQADIQKAVDRAAGRLPAAVPNKPVIDISSSGRIVMMEIHVAGRVPEEVLRRAARQLADGLREVDGVSGVEKVGYRDREVHILVEPERLHRLGISVDEVRRAVQARNLRQSGGSIESFVAEKKVLTVGQFDHPKEVADVIVRSAGPGNHVRIRDIARVVMGYEDWIIQSRHNGVIGIALNIRKRAEADALATAKRVKAFIAGARAALPAGVTVTVSNDMARFTMVMLEALVNNAAMGIGFVLLVLSAFFSFRFAFWVAFGLPAAFCVSFALMPLFGLGIDHMTLMAMILVLGMLVDDAIVTGESIIRHREMGLAPVEAGIEGTAAIARPVFLGAATTVLAFSPMIFLGGLEGKFMWALPVMIFLMLAGSLIECQFMLPSHLSHGGAIHTQKRWFRHIREAYDRLIVHAVRRRYLTIAVIVAATVGIVGGVGQFLRFSLYPELNIDTFFLKVELPEGASFEHTGEKVRELEGLVRRTVPDYDLLSVNTVIGHHDTDMFGVTEGRNPAWALVKVFMQPEGVRKTDSNAVIAALRTTVKDMEGFKSIIVEPLKDTPVAGKPVQVEVVGNDDSRFDLARHLVGYLKAHPATTGVWTSFKPGKDVVRLDLDYAALAARGLTVADVVDTVRIAFDGVVINELQTLDEKIDYRLQFRPAEQGKMETLRHLGVVNRDGLPVPLRAVAEFAVEPGEAAIKHYFGTRTVTVYADIDRARISTAEINAELARHVAGEGLMQRFDRLRLWYGGELEQQEEVLGNVVNAFILCVAAIFFLLVVLFNSFAQPFLIMTVIPFGFAGVVLAFVAQGMEMTAFAAFGVIGLVGVLLNDSLVMIDHLNRRRDGLVPAPGARRADLDGAAIADGAAQRLRPIVLTSLTTVAGLVPAAYGLGGANSWLAPMIMVMLWGILFGTLVTLFLLPCLYAAEQDLRRLVRRVAGGVVRRKEEGAGE